jgi:hypothetical protein
MFRIDARFAALLSVLFIAVGLFNLYMGRKRMLALRAQGRRVFWYKQSGILTGFEYALLGIVLMLNSGISSGFFSESEAVFVIPLYTGVLILAAVVLAVLLFQRITSRRTQNARVSSPVAEQRLSENDTLAKSAAVTSQQRTVQAQRRRERRKNAAAARRRQSGKA